MLPTRPTSPRALRAGLGVLAVSALTMATLTAAPASAETGSTSTDRGLARSAFIKRHDVLKQVPKGAEHVPSRALGLKADGAGGADVGEGVDADLRSLRGPVTVMLEMEATPAIRTFAANRSRGPSAARTAESNQRAVVRRAQAGVSARLGASATKAQVLFKVDTAYSGIAVRTDAARLGALAKLPGVKAVHRITPKSTTNASSVPLIGAPQAWEGSDQTGDGVSVGIIDTGIDYTHADFGGPGTVSAFNTAKASNAFAGTPKVVGGIDLVGDAYDPDTSPIPVPDANPLDCNGHGTHVAGTAAGLGVTTSGATYAGPYEADIPSSTFRVGPGVAPEADLYAIRVFGCDGSTDVVVQALDWAAQNHLDVVNMSLGSSYGSPQDPDAVASNNLAAAGTVVVASIGNSGDVYEIGGSPGNGARVLAVAASDDGNDVSDGLKITTPAGIEPVGTVDGVRDDVFAALESVAYDWAGDPGVTDTAMAMTGDWTAAPSADNNTDGCSAYSTADAAKVANKIAFQYWTEGSDRRCGSVARAANAKAAGAVAAVFAGDINGFSAGVTGDADIPAMITIKQATDAIRAKLEASVAVRATMTHALHNQVTISNADAIDQVASFSSRGTGMAGNLKPDVAAPGVTTFSAAVGTGNEGLSESGTSMAAPHVAGEAALVVGEHSTWSVEQVKAAIMNTATQDVFTGPDHSGDVFGPERVGAGRVVADRAVEASTLAYVKEDAGAVSVSFGPIAAAGVTRRTKTVKVQNTSTTGPAKTYSLAYQPANSTPGASYSVSPSTVSVAAGTTVEVKVTLVVDADQLRHTEDPTTESDPLGIGLQRSYRTDASGRLVLTSTSGATAGSTLRVPVWSAPRPASAMSASGTALSGTGLVQTGSIELFGRSVDQGLMKGTYASTVSAFQLQLSSPRLPDCTTPSQEGCVHFADERGADLKYVGTASDGPTYTDAGLDPYAPYADSASCDATSADRDCQISPALLTFGISSWGPWRTPASTVEHDIFLDGNGDGDPDAAIFNSRLTSGADDLDHFVAVTVDLRPGRVGDVLDQQLINTTDGSFETGLFNSDSLVMPVALHSLKDAGVITRTQPALRYQVASFSAYTDLADGDLSSSSVWKSLSVVSPGLGATGVEGFSTLSTDSEDAGLDVRRDSSTVGTDKPLGLLLLHHLNADGARAQVVSVRSRTTTRLTVNDNDYRYGGRPVFTATVRPVAAAGAATGTVTFLEGTRVLGTRSLVGGVAKAQFTGTTFRKGTHAITARYNSDPQNLGSTSAPLRITVRGLTATTTLRSNDTAYRYGGRPTVKATVAPSAATGTVSFRDGTRLLKSGVKLVNGVATYRLPVLSKGNHYITATYNGSAGYNPDRSPSLKHVVR